MRKLFLIVNLVLFSLTSGFSAYSMDVGGVISADTTWRMADSPVIVSSHVTIAEGVTLTIEPGVTVKFDEDQALFVDGTFVAKGTNVEKIIFTANGEQTPGFWDSISFSDKSIDASFDASENYTGGCIIQYSDIKYGGSSNPAVTISSSSPFIADSLITRSSTNGISITNGSPIIENCIIRGNRDSGISYSGDQSSTPRIQDCTITEHFFGGVGGGIHASGGNLLIRNSIIGVNSTLFAAGIYTSDTNLTIQNSIISGNFNSWNGAGIHASGGTLTIQGSTISGNSVYWNGGGIYANDVILTVQNSMFSGNSANSGAAIYANEGKVIMQRNIITENTDDSTVVEGVVALAGIKSGSVIGGSMDSANLIADNTGSGILIWGELELNYNDIYNNTRFELEFRNYPSEGSLDATNCYWGTTDESIIEDEIWDQRDDPKFALVYYKPFSTTPFIQNGFTVELQLDQGWNLISIPSPLLEATPDEALQSIDGKYLSVWAYRTTNPGGEWEKYIVGAPASSNNLESMDQGRGYWIEMSIPATATLNVQNAYVEPVLLRPGLNLVGYNSFTEQSRQQALSSIDGEYRYIWAYTDGEWETYIVGAPDFVNNLQTFRLGKGYWIDAKVLCLWDVNMGF